MCLIGTFQRNSNMAEWTRLHAPLCRPPTPSYAYPLPACNAISHNLYVLASNDSERVGWFCQMDSASHGRPKCTSPMPELREGPYFSDFTRSPASLGLFSWQFGEPPATWRGLCRPPGPCRAVRRLRHQPPRPPGESNSRHSVSWLADLC